MGNMPNIKVTGPVSGGTKGWPFGATVVDVAKAGYVEEEYFFSGTADRYRLVGGGEPGYDGRWDVEVAERAPYATRMIVYRPADEAAFNGTVVVVWNNVSGGYDIVTAGMDSPELVDGGFAIAAVTAQKAGVHGLAPGAQGLVDWDPERYGSLSITSDDYSYDIFTQAARLLAPDRPRQPVDPMGGLPVRKLIGYGASQSAGRLGTYVNAVQPVARVFDGFLLEVYFGSGTALEVGDFVVNVMDADVQQSSSRSLLRGSNLLRDDLDVPVMVVNSELEAAACYAVRQPDTDRFRYWETAGTSHMSTHTMELMGPVMQRDLGMGGAVMAGMNEVSIAPVVQAAFHGLQQWVNGGPPPPTQPRIEFAGDPAEIVRDEHGIATGGIRLPQVEVPVAVNSSVPKSNDIISMLGGACEPFPPAKLAALYPDRAIYLARFEEATRAAEKAGAILSREAEDLIAAARTTPLG